MYHISRWLIDNVHCFAWSRNAHSPIAFLIHLPIWREQHPLWNTNQESIRRCLVEKKTSNLTVDSMSRQNGAREWEREKEREREREKWETSSFFYFSSIKNGRHQLTRACRSNTLRVVHLDDITNSCLDSILFYSGLLACIYVPVSSPPWPPELSHGGYTAIDWNSIQSQHSCTRGARHHSE